jgi:hypothetical protein
MNLKRLLSFSASVVLFGAFSACTSAPKFNSEFNPEVDFTNFKTFAVVPFPRQIDNVDPGLLLRVTPAAKAAVEGSMEAKGYTLVENVDQADIAVLVHGRSVPKTDISGTGGFYPVYAGAWYSRYPYASLNVNTVTVDNYDEGTLIVEIYEQKDGEENQIWVGWTKGRIKKNTANQAARVAEAIRQILHRYPDQGTAAGEAVMGTK